MAETGEQEKRCRSCGGAIEADAKVCASCGAALDEPQEPDTPAADEDPRLLAVDPENRHEIGRYERLDEAELACGLLRASGIACELSPLPLPGLPADIILWVHNKDAELAWALLADAEREAMLREASNKDDEAA